MKINNIVVISFILFLTACSNNHEDLEQWMKEKTLAQKGQIKALPTVKTFIPIAFKAKIDPFKDKPVVALNIKENKYAPNPDRRKEPLEKYPLDTLKMVGTLLKDKITYALIKTPDGTVNTITVNNYIGQNYGKVINITESEITIDERFKNSNDEWEAKKGSISLDDGDKKR